MTGFNISLIVAAAAIAVSFFYGLFTRNYSTVDRLWSVLPPVYLLIWFRDIGFNPRYIVAFCLVVLWGSRLSVNFALKGGYRFSFRRGFTGEDYRWSILRGRIKNRAVFELFNLFFISGFQLLLIFLFTTPLYYYGKNNSSVNPFEILLYCLHFAFLFCETAADIQQLRFYRRKNTEPWKNQKRYRLGFNTFGLWRYSRHPNYVCEMSQWVVVYLYLVAASGTLHITGLGAVLLITLFAGSTVFVESVTLSKYPEYGEWRRLSSVWIPFRSLVKKKQGDEFLSSDK